MGLEGGYSKARLLTANRSYTRMGSGRTSGYIMRIRSERETTSCPSEEGLHVVGLHGQKDEIKRANRRSMKTDNRNRAPSEVGLERREISVLFLVLGHEHQRFSLRCTPFGPKRGRAIGCG